MLAWLVAILLAGSPEVAAAQDHLTGTSGDDVLIGTRLDDVIDGRRGRDLIRGGRGADTITAGLVQERTDFEPDRAFGGLGPDAIRVGPGDVVRAGWGDDEVWAYYVGEGDAVDCGPGEDVLHLHEDIGGLVTRGCETIRIEIAG